MSPAVRNRRALGTFGAVRRRAFFITAVAAAMTTVGFGVAVPSAGAAVGAAHTGPYYVAIGASESVGVQPLSSDHRGMRTDQGYTDDLTKLEQHRWPGLRLVDFGCPGITAQGALDGAGPCSYPAGSEVATAVRFIRGHPGEVALVTVDLGFNDVWPCLLHHRVDQACVATAMSRVSKSVRGILAALRAAGGPHLFIVGLEHADPYVATARIGDVAFAQGSVAVFDRLNDVLNSAYAAAHAVVAKVSDLRRGATGPKAVRAACESTWMCTLGNIHPTPDGYRVIAGAIASAIAGSRGGG